MKMLTSAIAKISAPIEFAIILTKGFILKDTFCCKCPSCIQCTGPKTPAETMEIERLRVIHHGKHFQW